MKKALSTALGTSLFALVLVSLFASCATMGAPTRSDPANGAIFGYFDMAEKDFGTLSGLSWFVYPQKVKAYVGTPSDLRYLTVGNAFFAFDAAPGFYYLPTIYATRQPRGTGPVVIGRPTVSTLQLLAFKMGDAEGNKALAEKSKVQVKPGQLLFAGCTALSLEKKPGLVSSGAFSAGPSRAKSERQVLEILLPALVGTPWEEPVKARMALLK